MPDFTHLHVHSDASLKDGLRSVDQLVKAAKSRGFKALALTDHGSLANAIAFTIECENAGIKPILGDEAYIEVDGEIGHITLLADGQEGWHNLIQLNNLGHASDRKQPAFTVDELVDHSKGLVCLSGCVSSPLNRMSFLDAKRLGARLKAHFGPKFFSEVMFVADSDTWSRPIKLSEELRTKLVVTNDVHFPNKDDAEIHPLLTKMKAGYSYNSAELWLKRPTEIYERAKIAGIGGDLFTEMYARAFKISELITQVKLARAPSLPHIGDADETLASKVRMALSRSKDVEYVSRTEYELDIIKRMGFSSYFLILHDIVSHAKEIGSKVGPGRGSGAGSLVLYLLGITTVDPIAFNLPFERFLNPEREGMPDVDTDFDSETRDQVIHYAERRWGASPIATYARYSHKTLVHDLAKLLRVPRELEKVAAESGEGSKEFEQICADFPSFGPAYGAINGQIRHKGKHAGGIVITDQEVPKERAGDIVVASWTEGEKNELSYAGIVKFDLLGLSVLTALKHLEERTGEKCKFDDDDVVYKRFRKGDLVGVFQFSGSSGIRDLTMKLAPTTFEDLVAVNALYRPGALDVGSAQKYPEWKVTPRKLHPIIDDILVPTYGAIVYQEQVMAIFSRIMGGSLGEADLARRVIVKSKADDPKWVEKFNRLKRDFADGCHVQAIDKELADELWEEIAAHARYSFNRAHAVSYAKIAYETMWWKTYHQTAFYAEMMNADPSEAQTYLIDAVKHGVDIVPPHVNYSTSKYEPKGNQIYLPLSSIKFLSPAAARVIEEERERKGKFVSISHFMERVPKRLVRGGAREGLFRLGGFLGLKGNSAELQVKDLIIPIDETVVQVHQKYLGMIIPDKMLFKWIDSQKANGLVAGVVSEIKKKESTWGPYTTYHLMPDGVFWCRPDPGLKVGDVVSARVNKGNGKALKIITRK